MIDQCSTDRLLEHFLKSMIKAELDFCFMLEVGTDGYNAKFKFGGLQSSDIFCQLGTKILSIGVFPLHITHKGIQAGVTKRNFHVTLLLYT